MRIIAGELSGRHIKTTVGPGYRPAMGKVRGALFSMLESRGVRWGACRVLDVFAGSGSLGFEALSRGAQEVCFIEFLPRAVELIRDNALSLGLEPQRVRIMAEDAGKALRRGPEQGYDVIFIDPPYGQRLLSPALKAIMRNGWLNEGGVINAEVEGGLRFDPAAEHPELTVLADRLYGQTRVVLWARNMEE